MRINAILDKMPIAEQVDLLKQINAKNTFN